MFICPFSENVNIITITLIIILMIIEEHVLALAFDLSIFESA